MDQAVVDGAPRVTATSLERSTHHPVAIAHLGPRITNDRSSSPVTLEFGRRKGVLDPDLGSAMSTTRHDRLRILLSQSLEEGVPFLDEDRGEEHRRYARLLKGAGGLVEATYLLTEEEAYNCSVSPPLMLELVVPASQVSGTVPGLVMTEWLVTRAGRRAGLAVGAFVVEATDAAEVGRALDETREVLRAGRTGSARRRAKRRSLPQSMKDAYLPEESASDMSTAPTQAKLDEFVEGLRRRCLRETGLPLCEGPDGRPLLPVCEVARWERARMATAFAAELMA